MIDNLEIAARPVNIVGVKPIDDRIPHPGDQACGLFSLLLALAD
jgi:hypothetical protein